MRKIAILVIVVLLAFSVFGVSDPENVTVIGDYINNISRGQTALVQLKENASTGYEWHWTATNPSVIQLRKGKNQVKGVEGSAGQAYNVIWEFTPVKAGETALIFKYYRSWEGEESAIETRVFNIAINTEMISGSVTENIVFLKDVVNELNMDNLAGIVLEENASTGYIWQYDISNPEILSLKSKIILNWNNEIVDGAPSSVIWEFNAINTGNCLLTFRKIRPWEDIDSAVETRYFNVNIRESSKISVNTGETLELKEIMNRINSGDLARIQLKENGSTGFTWQYKLSDPDILELVSKKTIENEVSNKVDGAPYKVIWEFKALRPGSVTITLKNFRTWEGEESAEDIRVFNVVVE